MSANTTTKAKRAFPYEIKDVDPDTNAQLLEDFKGERTGFVQVGPEKWFFPIKYRKDAEHYYNFEVRPDDVWIVTYPRSGTLLTQELTWLLANDLDYKSAHDTLMAKRCPFLEFNVFVHPEVHDEMMRYNEDSIENQNILEGVNNPQWEILNAQKTRRFIKTHLPFSLLPPELLTCGCKVIYVARNPKDVAVSNYHLNRLFRYTGYSGDFLKYWDDYFEKDLSYWPHVKQGWAQKYNKHVLFMFYEDLTKDLPRGVQKVAQFLEKPINEEQLATLVKHLQIDNFKKNKSLNNGHLLMKAVFNDGEQAFVRAGRNIAGKDHFTPELHKRADEWIKNNLKDTDLRFPIDILQK